MRIERFTFPVLALALAAGCAAKPPAQLALARETAKQVMTGTKSVLESEVRANGPAGALGACSRVAFDLARSHARDGWSVRRVSGKLRNPADAPDDWESAQLAEFATKYAGKPVPADAEAWEIVIEDGQRVLRYAKPIVIAGELCLRCHGDPATFAAAVTDSLARLYPNDQATGYRVGDLRGAVSVSIPL